MTPSLESPTKKQIDTLQMEREKLLSSTQRYKSALETQVSGVKENALRWGIQLAVFGGVAITTFLVVKAFSGKKKKAIKPNGLAKTSFTSSLFASIQSYIISFILSMAREQIVSYLEKTLLKQNAHYQEPSGETSSKI